LTFFGYLRPFIKLAVLKTSVLNTWGIWLQHGENLKGSFSSWVCSEEMLWSVASVVPTKMASHAGQQQKLTSTMTPLTCSCNPNLPEVIQKLKMSDKVSFQTIQKSCHKF
jgi:hypothetical protein